MRPRCVALLAVVALAGGLSACGADDELSTDIPRTSPDLTIPTATTEVTPSQSSTTGTSTTRHVDDGAVRWRRPAGGRPAARGRRAAGRAAARRQHDRRRRSAEQRQATTGGANAGDSEFQNFCRDNPGAPPPC